MKTSLLAVLLLALPAFAITPAECKKSCKSEFKSKCEQACRDHAKKMLDTCINQMCGDTVKSCERQCDNPPKPLTK